MRLFIAEKPSVGKAVAQILGITKRGNGVLECGTDTVTWAFGHLYEQAQPDQYRAEWKSWSAAQLPMVPETWKIYPKPDAKERLQVIKGLVKQATEVVIATDCDDEGELIGWEILEALGYKGKVKRLWLSALDDASIRTALASMKDGKATYPLKLAAESRGRADWLVGMNLSRAATLSYRANGGEGVLSVGRVQTPTLALVVARDMEIENFKAKAYYDLEAQCQFAAGGLAAQWVPPASALDPVVEKVLDKALADGVAKAVQGQPAKVVKAEAKQVSKAAPNPYSLAGIQAAASAQLGLSAQQTLDVCQALYETHKVATYPRTDCGYLPESMHGEARRVLGSLAKVYPDLVKAADADRKHEAFNDKKVTAHHGIVPTGDLSGYGGLGEVERQVFDLIAKAYIALFLPDFRYTQTAIQLDIAGHAFVVSGRVVNDPGWRVVRSEKEADQVLPPVKQGDAGVCEAAQVLAKQTKPPARFTEGSLIAAMENVAGHVSNPEIRKLLNGAGGLGTPATRAAMLETLKKRGFVKTEKKSLVSTELGRQLISFLPTELAKPDLTAAYEKRLAQIRTGEAEPKTFLENQVVAVTALVKKLLGSQMQVAGAKVCPKCGKNMRLIQAKGSAFYGCSGYPDCRHTEQAGTRSVKSTEKAGTRSVKSAEPAEAGKPKAARSKRK